MVQLIVGHAAILLALLCGVHAQSFAANPPTESLSSASFAKRAELSGPNLSPDGQHLALVVLATEGGESKYQLVVLSMPDLKPLNRLDFSTGSLPIDVNWVNDQRLVMGVGRERSLGRAPRPSGEIIAVDLDGKNKRVLVGDRSRRAIGGASGSLTLPVGFASIAGTPAPSNGHVYLTLQIAEVRGAGNRVQRTAVYDVDAVNGGTKEIGSIDKDSYRFLVQDGVARYAYGLDDGSREHVYFRSNADDEWTEIAPDRVGKYLVPLFLSADGAKLYSISNASGGPGEFVRSELDGSKRVVLAADPRADVGAVYRSAMPRSPYAVTINDGRPRIIYLDESKYAKALSGIGNRYPDHFVTFSDLSETGDTAIVYAVSDRDPGSYALYDFRTSTLRPLFQSAPWLKPEQLGERRPFQFKAASGVSISGFLNFPPSGANARLPTILMPHDGPINVANAWAMTGWEEREAQFLASRGYLVVQVNYRGSAGHGRNFADSGKRQVASGMLDDQLGALAWAVANGHADRQRVCVYGAGYGGYAAYELPLRAPKNTFRCAIAFAAVSDIRLQTEQERYELAVQRETWGMDDPHFVEANSPINHIDEFSVPLLIIHGRDDPVVAVGNALAVMDALAKRGKPFTSLIRAKEGHGFIDEQANTERYDAIAAFLQKQLGR